MLGARDDPERGRLAGREAAPKFFASPLERSACFDAILGKSSPKSNRLALGRGWSARPILSLFMATRLKTGNLQSPTNIGTVQGLILCHLWIHLGLNIKHVGTKGGLLCLAWTSAQRPVLCHAWNRLRTQLISIHELSSIENSFNWGPFTIPGLTVLQKTSDK